MISYLMSSICLIAGVLVVCGCLASKFGADDMSSKGKGLFSAGSTIIVLYLIFNTVYCTGYDFRGIPFSGIINKYGSIKEYMHQSPAEFSYEVAQLVTLTILITLATKVIPSSAGGSGFDGKVLYKVIIVITSIIINHYVVCEIEDKPIFKYLVKFINVFVAGGTIALTPIMLLGKIVASVTGLQGDNKLVLYLMEKLPETELGRIIKASFSSSMVMLFALFSLEQVYGSAGQAVDNLSVLLRSCGPLIVLLIGTLMAWSILKKLLGL